MGVVAVVLVGLWVMAQGGVRWAGGIDPGVLAQGALWVLCGHALSRLWTHAQVDASGAWQAGAGPRFRAHLAWAVLPVYACGLLLMAALLALLWPHALRAQSVFSVGAQVLLLPLAGPWAWSSRELLLPHAVVLAQMACFVCLWPWLFARRRLWLLRVMLLCSVVLLAGMSGGLVQGLAWLQAALGRVGLSADVLQRARSWVQPGAWAWQSPVAAFFMLGLGVLVHRFGHAPQVPVVVRRTFHVGMWTMVWLAALAPLLAALTFPAARALPWLRDAWAGALMGALLARCFGAHGQAAHQRWLGGVALAGWMVHGAVHLFLQSMEPVRQAMLRARPPQWPWLWSEAWDAEVLVLGTALLAVLVHLAVARPLQSWRLGWRLEWRLSVPAVLRPGRVRPKVDIAPAMASATRGPARAPAHMPARDDARWRRPVAADAQHGLAVASRW